MIRRWRGPAILAAAGLLLGARELADGSPIAGAVLLLVFTLGAVAVSPRAFPRSVTEAEARAAGGPIVYWRPGCPFCIRLRTTLRRDAARLQWVDIWRDPAGAATVRGITGGDETVPTVVAGERTFVNPAPSVVRALVRGSGPRH